MTTTLTAVDSAVEQLADGLAYPVAMALDDADTPCDVIDLLALAEFTTGAQPWARTSRVDRVRADATLLPSGARVIRRAVDGRRRAELAVGPGWTLRAVRWPNDAAEVTVTATSEELAVAVLDEAVRDAAEPVQPAAVQIGFWYSSPRRGPVRTFRPIETLTWDGIRRNYPASVAVAFDRLMALRPDDVTGRLLLLHGPPGTGKTTALRTLAEHWRDWCQVDCVLDPEALFSTPAYLLDMLVDDDGDEDSGPRWRLLLLEDCDELIRGDAKNVSGQALSRLLNLTDGLFGQGRRVLVGITTNEDLARLHPAVTRPGRCLARIEVGRLSAAEASAWLGEPVPAPATLAELYARQSGAPVPDREPAIGGYL